MNTLVTLFFSESDHRDRARVSSSGGAPFWAYLPGEALDGPQPSSAWSKGIESVEPHLRMGGGLLLRTSGGDDASAAYVQGAPATSYEPPSHFLRLRSESETSLERLTFDGWIQLTADERWIVPVSAAADKELQSWWELLKGLPEDLRRTVLNALRRPSFDSRLERLEKVDDERRAIADRIDQVNERPEGIAGSEEQIMAPPKPREPWRWPLALSSIGAVTLAGVALLGLDRGGVLSLAPAETGTPAATLQVCPSVPVVETAPPPARSPTTFEDAWGALLPAVRASKNASLNQIAETHLLMPFASPESRVIGLVKVLIVTFGGSLPPEALASPVWGLGSAKALGDVWPKLPEEVQQVVLYASCTGPKTEPLPLAPPATVPRPLTCNALDTKAGVKGIEMVTRKVKGDVAPAGSTAPTGVPAQGSPGTAATAVSSASAPNASGMPTAPPRGPASTGTPTAQPATSATSAPKKGP